MKLVLATALGIGFLFVFFRAVRIQWPESYFGTSAISVYAISASPIRYAAFRLAPVYITCVFVAVSLDRAGGNGLLAAALVGLGHGLISAGWSLLGLFRLPGGIRRKRRALELMFMVVFAGVVATSLLGAITRGLWAPLVPKAGDLAATLWTALIAGVVGAFVVGASRRQVDAYEVLRRSMKSIPASLWESAGSISRSEGVDPILMRAVMVAENVERPAWFRRLERLKAPILREGTYGIMQVYSKTPLSDLDSIRQAAERMKDVRVTDENGYPERLQEFAKGWNPDPAFGELLQNAWYEVSARMEEESAS